MEASRRIGKRKTNDGSYQNYELHGQQLLPGIPNEIALDEITSKVPWKTCQTLSSVSSAWNEAFRSRQVCDARIRRDAAQNFLLINHLLRFDETRDCCQRLIGVYSIMDKTFHFLPGIPETKLGIRKCCQSVALDGKIYALGGIEDHDAFSGSRSVYVIDLLGQRGWSRCASMNYGRAEFGCCVLHGQIYVCGGWSDGPVIVPEVYDPKSDSWSPIKSMTSMRFGHQVSTLGDELLAHGGEVFNPIYWDGAREVVLEVVPDDYSDYALDVDFSEVYNPVRDEWRKVEPAHRFSHTPMRVLFTAQGKIHSMDMSRNMCAIRVYDLDKNSWLDGDSLAAIESLPRRLLTTLVVGSEFVALLSYFKAQHHEYMCNRILVGSRGEKMWKRAECPIGRNPFICAFQL